MLSRPHSIISLVLLQLLFCSVTTVATAARCIYFTPKVLQIVNFSKLLISSLLVTCIFAGSNAQSVPFIGPDELPPPYQSSGTGGVPMVTCRVCQNMIDITTKREQHVVKCTHCTEATVSSYQKYTFYQI